MVFNMKQLDKETATFIFKLSKHLKDELENMADDDETSASALLRGLIKEDIKRRSKSE